MPADQPPDSVPLASVSETENGIPDPTSGRFMEAVLNTAIDAVFTIDAKGTILWVNLAATRMFGWSREEFLGRNINMVVPPPDHEHHDEFLAAYTPRKQMTHVLGAGGWLEAVRKDGQRLPVEVGLCPFEQNGQRFFTGFVRDISERRAAEDKLRHLATHDELTGLPNLRMLGSIIDDALSRGAEAAVLCIKLVGLQRIGDRHGRAALEHVLRDVAARLSPLCGPGRVLARQGDDELALATSAGDADILGERVAAIVAQPVAWKSITLHIAPAIGVAAMGGSITTGERLLRAAHAASGLAIRQIGGEAVVTFSGAVDAKLSREATMEDQLRQAIAGEGLSLALQPKVRAADGVIVGAEALLRWHDSVLGDVSPAEFIPLAERTGIIGDISAWVMRHALAELSDWQAQGLHLSLAINISAVDLRHPDLGAWVTGAIAEAGCDPAGVVIELTESALADDPALASRQLENLKALGLSLSLDDFGTGYSSLSYLRHFPVDSLKIDQSFVRDLPDNKDAVAVARTIIDLAHALRLKTIAEGVETEAQAALLRELGVDLLQGFLFSRPVPPARFRALVEQSAA